MPDNRLLVANRGEIAMRILRAAAEMDWSTVAIHSEDDATSLHVRKADTAVALKGAGARAYLDVEQILAAAVEHGATAIHPGYGFLAESPALARACAERGVAFVGPSAEVLELLGDKVQARALAERLGVPVLPATGAGIGADEAAAFLDSEAAGGAIVIKAVAGGGGRGMRVVRSAGAVAEAHTRCQSEARAAFGNGDVYAERLVERARHVEVQIVGDGQAVGHLWERECSLQRRHQKLVEIAPAPRLSPSVRDAILEAAQTLAGEVGYRNLGTFEFLVDDASGDFFFIEANPRLQVEHTVTEAITGVDLVQTQLSISGGAKLSELGLASPPAPRGFALQARVNMESMDASGQARPASGTLTAFELPSGPGVRVDTFGYAGYTPSGAFDSLLAKVIVHSPSEDPARAIRRGYRALCDFHVGGIDTNLGFLRSLLARPELAEGRVTTDFVERHVAELVAQSGAHATLHAAPPAEAGPATGRAGAQIDHSDPLAVLEHGKTGVASGAPAPGQAPAPRPELAGPPGTLAVRAPMQGTVVSVEAAPDAPVHAGDQLLVMEAMKMEHVVEAPVSGLVRRIDVAAGDTVYEGHALLFIEEADVGAAAEKAQAALDLDHVRPDLAEVFERHAFGLDENRPEAVAKRRATGHRTARENIADLVDPDSFVEYGPLVVAAQRRRRSIQDLREKTPADGMVAGVARVNGELVGAERAQCVVMSYDYMVLAGTQGAQNHRKKDRMFEIAESSRLPVVIFTEGGGGRPGDSDGLGVSGLDCLAFAYFGKLSGLVPLVGITTGRCFAGNAALLGCCDVTIATKGANIGMGGPAMIEGGGLGVFKPEEVGPLDVQRVNGVVDVAVEDEAEAVAVARKYLSYFQGPIEGFEVADQRLLRSLIPENRLRIYDVRQVIETLADRDSVLELRRDFGLGMVTALARVGGRPLGIIANNPTHLAGAIDADAADKAARFMQLCDAFDLPILMLCDTPGIMVGPEAEKTGLVRHVARMFVTGASLSVPFFTIVLRKGYGLGAQLMAGGSFKAPFFLVSWPTGEFGGMGLEGAIKLGFRKELAAIEDPAQRKDTFEKMVAAAYDHGKAVNVASHFEFDEVIDPAESRKWILSALYSAPEPPARSGKKRPCVDTW